MIPSILHRYSGPNADLRVKRLSMAMAILALLAMTGCGESVVTSTPIATSPTVTKQISGRVFGGQAPIQGALIQLYAVNLSTLKGPSTPLISATVTTDQAGDFNITGLYTCPTAALVYMTATGGNAGGGSNSAIVQMAGLGLCSNLSSSTYINMNELTTVATVYGLAPYMADYADIGAASWNLSGITNAFLTINSLVNIGTGYSPGSIPAGASVPTAELNTLANVVASCVNSTLPGTACSSLFALALPASGSPVPTTTASAVLNMARNPGLNVLNIFKQKLPQVPFLPQLLEAPNDWTVSIKLTGSGLNSPYGVAIDASGDAWVTNEGGTSVTEFGPTGTVLSGATGFGNGVVLGPQGITVDGTGNIWIANTGASSVIEMSPNGTLKSPNGGYTSPSIIAPVDVAADARGNIWVANFLGNSITELNSAGGLVGSGGLTAEGTLLRPDAVAIDASGEVWISNSGQGTLTKFDKNADLISTGNGYTDNALQAPAGVALDTSARAWAAGTGASELSGFSVSGAPLSTSPVYGVLNQPTGVAVDGAGNIWVANGTTTGYLSEFTAGSGVALSSSQALGVLNDPVEVAVDESGNIWAADAGDNSVTIFVGLATPALTPLVAQTN